MDPATINLYFLYNYYLANKFIEFEFEFVEAQQKCKNYEGNPLTFLLSWIIC